MLQWFLGSSCVSHKQYCVFSGADVDHQDRYGETALIRAAKFGNVEIVVQLIQAGQRNSYLDLYIVCSIKSSLRV